MTKRQWKKDTDYKIDPYIENYNYKSITNSFGTQNAGRARANSFWIKLMGWLTVIFLALCIALFISSLAISDDDQKEALDIAGVVFFWVGIIWFIMTWLLMRFLIKLPLKKRIKLFDTLLSNGFLKNDAVYPESINMAMESDEKWNSSTHTIFKRKSLFNSYIGISHFIDQLNLIIVNPQMQIPQTPLNPVNSAAPTSQETTKTDPVSTTPSLPDDLNK